MSIETRQKIPVPRRSFLWSLNETSGEILTHVGPTEFTPSANDRIVKSNERGGYEQAPMEARAFVVVRDGEYVLLANPIRMEQESESPNGSWLPGGNKEKELALGTTRIIPGPCAFALWPGQSAEVRPAHKLGANHYLLVEVVGPLDEKARYYRLVLESAGLLSAVIDSSKSDETGAMPPADIRPSPEPGAGHTPAQLRLGQRIVVQGRHTQLFIPPSGIEIVAPVEDSETTSTQRETDADGLAALPPAAAQEHAKLQAQVREGISSRQFSVLKNELRHRQDLTTGQRAVILTSLDTVFEERSIAQQQALRKRGGGERRASTSLADPYARRAVVLGPKEFCILFDADGNPRIVRGPARVFPGPHDAFLQRGSRRRVYDAYELAEHQALWLRVIASISRERLAERLPPGYALDRETYNAGHELIVKGSPSVFFPFIEAEVIHPETREPHTGNDHSTVVFDACGIDQKSGIYVRDLRTGMVKMIRGETSYLVDPRFEEHVLRRVPKEQWNLWIGHAEPHKVITREEAVSTPWAVSVTVPNLEACLITSRHGRRAELGPKVVLLEYEETIAQLKLSKGASKDGHAAVPTAFLRVQGARVADTFEVDSIDFVRFKVRLGFSGHFEGEANLWFNVDDPVKLLADTARARVRESCRRHTATRLLHDVSQVVREALLGEGGALRFPENGMVIDAVDVLSSVISDQSLAEMFHGVQREAVRLHLQDQQATRRLDSARHQDHVSTDEHGLLRNEARRKVDTRSLEIELEHSVTLKGIELSSERARTDQDAKKKLMSEALDFALSSEERTSTSRTSRQLQESEAGARSKGFEHRAEEAHLGAVADIEKSHARGLAEADAVRLAAIQPELVGALHTASDSEVMKIAAANMNLVSLLGGKSPAELFSQVLRGTAPERTLRSMAERAGVHTDDTEE